MWKYLDVNCESQSFPDKTEPTLCVCVFCVYVCREQEQER